MKVLEKILEEIKEMRNIMESTVAMDCFGKDCEHDDCTVCVCERAMEIIRSHMYEVENDEKLIKKYVTNRQVIRDFYNKPLYIKGCPKCGCELKSCETDYCRACGQALIWENPEGGL